MSLMTHSDAYAAQLQEMHRGNANFGKRGSRWLPVVEAVMESIGGTTDILDYGCGKGELNLHMPFGISMYDPGIVVHSDKPEPADIVICTDVMEHIEPLYVGDVIMELHKLTLERLIMCVSCRPAIKQLPDGRNAHLIIQPPDFWLKRFNQAGFVTETALGETATDDPEFPVNDVTWVFKRK